MRKLLMLALLVVPVVAMAQMKIVESSERKTPQWVGSTSKDVFVVTASAPSIDEAKELALQEVKKQIIEAIALHVTSETNITMSQTTTQGDNVDLNQQLESKFETHAAKLPFVKGISLSKVNRYYWEKARNKKTKEEIYGYTIEYPFSETDLRKLTMEFDKIDASMVDKLVNIEQVARNFKTTEQLDDALMHVSVLENYFFDEVRLTRTKAAAQFARKQFSYIKPVVAFNSSSQAVIVIAVGEKIITSTQRPSIKSNCATQVSIKHQNGRVLVDFDNSGCVDSEENFIEAVYRFGGNLAKDKAYFNINENRLDVKIDGKLDVMVVDSARAKVTFKMTSNSTPFEIVSCYLARNG